ncbi:hypothetical protein V6N11_058882 [Hibiscus sabdariffa]|uniref:RRM domain-containing protein n=1 Tax=Hibiscus sabdariffa TaxID=183260 RepID=A0ABR2U6C6_9ROSI
MAGKVKFDNGNQEVISLFVENLPETLHWKGLWFSFARHGEVVSVYIARKKSRGGKRFGFIRMKNLVEAERVMERLHGFTLYGSRLCVKRARNTFEWERKNVVKPPVYKPGPSGSDKCEGHGVGENSCGSRQVCNGPLEEKLCNKRISGHVEKEDLWLLRRSLSRGEGSDELTGVSKSDSERRVDVECSDRSRPSMEEEALQTMCTERNGINGVSRDEEALRGQINLSELMGGEPITLPVTSVEGLEKVGSRGSVDLKGTNEEIGEDCVGLIHKYSIGELGLSYGPMSIVGPDLNRKEGELVNIPKEAMGLDVLKDRGNCDPPLVKNLTWADKVKLNAGQHGLRDNPVVGASDVVLEGGFIAECEEIKGRRRKGKARKFGHSFDSC